MTVLARMADAAFLPSPLPAADGFAFYIGGNTPHVWTDAEIALLKKTYRFLLPIFTRSNPVYSYAQNDGAALIAACRRVGLAPGKLVAVDLESAVNPAYVKALDAIVVAAGWKLVEYGQLSTVGQNPITSGGYWVGYWDGVANDPGWTGKQYEDVGPYDLSEFDETNLWDLRAPAPAPVPPLPPVITEEFMSQLEVYRITGDDRVYAVHQSGKMFHLAEPASLESVLAAKPVEYTVSKATMADLKTALGYTGA